MPKSCCVTFCSNNNKKNLEKKFFLLPSNVVLRKAWLTAINRVAVDREGNVKKGKLWSPKSKWIYVCSDHFISGKKKTKIFFMYCSL